MNQAVRWARSLAGILKASVRGILDSRRYARPGGYDAERYWKDRHSKYGFDLRGVGNKQLSEEENRRMYLEARDTFLSVCREAGVSLEAARVLDIGCGVGFYAGILRECGNRSYVGVDIVDVLFAELRQRFPDFEFRKLDVTAEPIPGEYDVVLMIDVTQHITADDKFSFAMQNVKRVLAPGGAFIVTSWLSDDARDSFYERSRSIAHYEREFPDCTIGSPVPFRDKSVFFIRKPR